MTEDAKLTVTLKGGTKSDSPWIVLRADSPADLQSTLQALEGGTVFADIGRTAALFQESAKAQGQLGWTLGAKGVDPVGHVEQQPQVPTPTAPSASEKPANPTVQPVAQPVAEAAQETPSEPLKPTSTTVQETPGMSPSTGGGMKPQTMTPIAPGAPVIMGTPAIFWSGEVDGEKKAAYLDPRPGDVLQTISEVTDDPNDPRLTEGTVKFMSWL